MKKSAFKGKILEIYTQRLLEDCGFTKVQPDGLYVFNRSKPGGYPFIMVRGLGQDHNADVLLHPPINIPFLYPIRLLVECKNYSSHVGLPTVRSLLGMREDINNFRIIDMATLANRFKPNYSISGHTPKFNYQVALATTYGITPQAEEFALTYKIPIEKNGREYCRLQPSR